jgi:hypothetical protein
MKIIPKFAIGGISTVTTNPRTNWFTRAGMGIIEKTYNDLKLLSDRYK